MAERVRSTDMKSAFGVEHETEISKISLSPFRTKGITPGRIASIKHLRAEKKASKNAAWMNRQPQPAPAAAPEKAPMSRGMVGGLAATGGLAGGYGLSQINRR